MIDLEIQIRELHGTEGSYHHATNTILLGNWSKPFNCAYARSHSITDRDFDRVLHVLNHELLHMAIHCVAGHLESVGLDDIISHTNTESWEGVAE